MLGIEAFFSFSGLYHIWRPFLILRQSVREIIVGRVDEYGEPGEDDRVADEADHPVDGAQGKELNHVPDGKADQAADQGFYEKEGAEFRTRLPVFFFKVVPDAFHGKSPIPAFWPCQGSNCRPCRACRRNNSSPYEYIYYRVCL